MSFLAQLLHIALVFAAAPLLPGLVRWGRARLLGRAGPSPVQPVRDLGRLLRKQPVLAENASPLFTAAPVVCLAAIGAAAVLVPSFSLGMASAPLADLIVIAGLLGLARAVLALAAMDVGTAFGGIGASRGMAYAALAEPALLLVVLTLALFAGTTNLDAIAALTHDGLGLRVSLGLALVATVAVAVVETGRMPVDNPASHLELTMTHEAMLLEYSGRHLALLEYAAALRLLLWLSLIAAIFIPFGAAMPEDGVTGWGLGIGAWGGKMLVLAGALAGLEAMIARMRLFRVPEFLGVALLLALLAAMFLFVAEGLA